MNQTKKVFTRMCLNNWGGIDHKILEFNEYVNLFSGKSGSGKSTVMDAIQVILYGSFSPAFLNKAADDSKNKRSVFSYLRGEQKDGSANRDGQDFCSTIALEIFDTQTQTYSCIGIAFDVHHFDTEVKKFIYFSHSGQMPDPGYLTTDGIPYSNQEIKHFIENRAKSEDNRGKYDINRIYPSKESYLNTLYGVILGDIDGNRFITMEKSAIALKMTNGTGQFIKDYMFPKSTADTIEKISEQLGAYRDIKEKIEDIHNRINLLTEVKEAGDELLILQTDIIRAQAMIRCIDVEDLKAKIEASNDDLARILKTQEAVEQKRNVLVQQREAIEQDLIRVSADLQSSDLGSKQQQYDELEARSLILADNSKQWRSILNGLKRWEEDEIVTEYLSNNLLNMLDQFSKGSVTVEEYRKLQERIASEKENIEEELEAYNEQKRELSKELKEKQRLVDDMSNNRKTYSENIRNARSILERRLCDRYGRKIKVQILADLFDVCDEEWKNAIEGRMGNLKFSLVTEPVYALDAAKIFRELKKFEEVNLINTHAIMQSNPKVYDNSLYEAVEAKEDYVDACLKRYLGHIIKCNSIEELEEAKDGVMTDCYSYSNFMFRQLKKRDYTVNACIGSKVSKTRLAEYEADVKQLEEEYSQIIRITNGLHAVHEFESLKHDSEYVLRLSKSENELSKVNKKKQELETAIHLLKEGEYQELEQKKLELETQMTDLQMELDANQKEMNQLIHRQEHISSENENRQQLLTEKTEGYRPDLQLVEEVDSLLKTRSGMSLRNEKTNQITRLESKVQTLLETLQSARNRYIFAYPSCGFNGAEKSNDVYEKQLEAYLTDYEPKYEAEFEKQCNFIYQSLRENVIATIHGDIKAAKRHAFEINRLLKETNFSDSTYQIKIEPAKNENGQFFDMLMAEELDSKNFDNGGFEGQLSLGEDDFYQKYAAKIELLTEKFMPIRETDERLVEQKRKEMEQYADYRNYLSFSMFEQVTDEEGNIIRENFVDDMAGRDSGGEGQNPKYVALLAGFAMLYMQQNARNSKIKLVLLDEAFSKMDQERSAVCLKYARKMNLQLIVCVPDERLQSLIQNVDSVYGFRRHNNQISMMHIDKGNYLKLVEGNES